MTEKDVNLSEWIGREETAPADIITPRLIAQFNATVGSQLPTTDSIPPGMHWCLAPPAVATGGLGNDGHPEKGGFLPPVTLPRRMWAGGEIQFLAKLQPNDVVHKHSIIKNIASKSGKSGPLCFVTVEHSYRTNTGIAIQENQNIVYREAATKLAAAPSPSGIDIKFDETIDVDVSTVTLFRYSAITFNGHRIHYDLNYAQQTEYYENLVIHGPLQATLLLNFATTVYGKCPRTFTYKGVAPALGAQTLQLGLSRLDNACELSVIDENGLLTMSATATW